MTVRELANATAKVSETGGKIVDFFRDVIGLDATVIAKNAKAEASAIQLKAHAESQAEVQLALSRVVSRELKKAQNLSEIVNMGSQFFPESQPLQLTEGFVERFANAAEDVSEPDLQLLWAKLLAQEALIEGSTSPRTLSMMRQFSRYDAELVEKYARYAITIFNGTGILVMKGEMFPFEQEYHEKMHLEDIGILKNDDNIVMKCPPNREKFPIQYIDKVVYGSNPSNEVIDIYAQPFSISGAEILKVVTPNPYPEYFDVAISYLRRVGLKITES